MSKSELLKVYSEMLKLYLRLKSDDKISESEVLRIYREYLMLSMKISFNSPSFIEDRYNYKNGNCYCYAIGFNTPRIIGKKYFESCSRILRHNVGFISGLPCYNDRKSAIRALESDLRCLNIEFYECELDSENKHGGYKIAIFNAPYDVHLIRQNVDGTWSHKMGYTDTIERVDMEKHEIFESYKYIKTLEIVKPVVR